MNKKFLMGLAPVFAIVALAVMPTVAQALPHIYSNGTILPEGEQHQTLAWGTLSLTAKEIGVLECENTLGGYSENPSGGGSGGGKVQMFTPYDCTDTSCPAAAGTVVSVTSENLPWKVLVVEPSAGVFRNESGASGVKGAAETIEVLFKCTVLGTEKIKDKFWGTQSPLTKNGSGIGSKPSTTIFDAACPKACELEGELGPGGTKGTLKVMGYAAQEVIAIHSP